VSGPKLGKALRVTFKRHPWQGFAHLAVTPRGPSAPLISYGPSILGLRSGAQQQGGPEAFYEANLALFATGTTSRDEAFFAWALDQLLGPEGRQGGWIYQSNLKRTAGAVVDFRIIRQGGLPDLGIRIQSEFFHENMGTFKQAYDVEQIYALEASGDLEVYDVWSQWYIDDLTGQAVLAVARDALAGVHRLSPLVTGGL
jgi:hypothetical protein